MSKSVITVKIFGNEYTIKGVAQPDYIITLANYLNNSMQEVQDATGLKDTKKIAILAAINICDELFDTKKSLKEDHVPAEQFRAVRNKVENMIGLIDSELPELSEKSPPPENSGGSAGSGPEMSDDASKNAGSDTHDIRDIDIQEDENEDDNSSSRENEDERND
ncbi:MAG: cell division protein ZapA [Candidatus Goldiibacteriota bacterium]